MPCTSGLFQVFDIWTAWFAIKSHWPHSPIWMHICANTVKVCVRCNVCGTRCCKCIGATSGFMAHFEIVSIYNHSMTILNKNGNTYNVACGLYVIILVIAIWNVFFFNQYAPKMLRLCATILRVWCLQRHTCKFHFGI